MTKFHIDPRYRHLSGISDDGLRNILSRTAYDFSTFGAFIVISMVFILSGYEISSTTAMAMFLGLLLVFARLYNLWQVRRLLTEDLKGTSDARWLIGQINISRLALFFLTGAAIGATTLLIGIKLNDLFKLSAGTVPSLTVLGAKVYLTGVAAVLAFFIGLWGFKRTADVWAARRVRSMRLEG